MMDPFNIHRDPIETALDQPSCQFSTSSFILSDLPRLRREKQKRRRQTWLPNFDFRPGKEKTKWSHATVHLPRPSQPHYTRR
jgi:hypothetical protein